MGTGAGRGGGTPLPDVSVLVSDQVGWTACARQAAAAAVDPGAGGITTCYGQAGAIARFGPASCSVLARLDNGVGVDHEERGAPVAVCRDPLRPWSQLWPRLAHLD